MRPLGLVNGGEEGRDELGNTVGGGGRRSGGGRRLLKMLGDLVFGGGYL
jgi:hypothetical protein